MRTRFKIELNLEKPFEKIELPCGCKNLTYIFLENIWQETGADMPGEKGHWICEKCNIKYFFYLY